MDKVELRGADLSGANLIGANLSGADMSEAKFHNAKLAFARIDLAIVLASNMRDADLTGAVIVFEDSEGGEAWESFSDSLAEARDLKEMQTLFNTACANPRFAPALHPLLEVKPPRRRCASEQDYIQYSLKYSRKDWGIPTAELLNVKETTSRASTGLTTEGHRSQRQVNQAPAGINPNCFNALIQRGALRLTESAS